MKAIVIPELKGVPDSEASPEFLNGMVNRMGVSFFKYGPVADAYPNRVNALDSLRARVDKYLATGNTEFLMDVANFAMIEFMHPRQDGAHFRATDSDESPGRVWNTGTVNAERNNHEAVELREKLYSREGG